MNKYFYNDGFREFGPFTPQELLDKNIRPDYKLRLDGTSELKPAREIIEVATLFKQKQNEQQQAYQNTSNIPQQPNPDINNQQAAPETFERDLSFEQQSYQVTQNNSSNRVNYTAAPQSVGWRPKLLLAIISFWLFDNLLDWLFTSLSIRLWHGPGQAIRIFINILFAFIPLLLAICIKKSSLRVIAIVFAVIIVISQLARQVYWLVN
ncbi:hypothetical protein [uncultured Nonlabens sp.]|uniref:hypothetical protein n=1 Tax=uncultured Nonlabens sp. TaxID=859306 RepID=UPI00263281EA|nr:hypothetical protein [uncultured Nonlabens sp.]